MNAIESIASRMQIAILTQGAWNPLKTHDGETREENRRHGLNNDAEVRVRLTKHDALASAMTVKHKIYTEHKRLTLPSPQDGMRVVPGARLFEHSEKLQELDAAYHKHVDRFLSDYDEVVNDARKRLGVLYDSKLFPSEKEMRGKFYNKVRYMECPTNGAWGEWINETVQLGQLELRSRIVGSARKLIEVCSGDGKLYSSVLDKLDDICRLAGDLNLTEDPIIARAAKELLPVANDYPVDVLRDSEVLRRETARRADSILKALNL